MIQPRSILKVTDNSGAKMIRCIKPVSKSKKVAGLAEAITASVIVASPNSAVKKKSVIKAVIVRCRKPYLRPNGTVIRFDDNAAVIVNPDNTPKASRIFGPVCQELRQSLYGKIATMAKEVI